MSIEAENSGVTEPEALPAPAPPDGRQKKRRRRRKVVKWAVILAVLAVAAIVGRRVYNRFRTGAEIQASPFMAEPAQRRDIVSSLSGSGALTPADSYTVTSLIEGEILAAGFSEGDVVEKDTVLYVVDSSDTASSIERAELSLSSARNNYNRQVEGLDKLSVASRESGYAVSVTVKPGDTVSPGQQLIHLADYSVMTIEIPFLAGDAEGFYIGQGAEVTLDDSFETLYGSVTKIGTTNSALTGNIIVRHITIDVQNPGGLSPGHMASASVGGAQCSDSGAFKYKSESDITADAAGDVVSVNVYEGGYVNAGDVVVSLSSTSLGDQIDSAYRSVRDAEIALDNQRDQLDSYTITSPISGTIVEKVYKEGDNLGAGKVLCTIYDMSYLEFTMNIDELDIKQIETGQRVSVTADAMEGESFVGIVTKLSIQGATSGGVTTYPVTVRIDDAGGLLPGMNVNAEIVTESVTGVITVPIAAVQRGNRVIVNRGGDVSLVTDMRSLPEGFELVEVATGASDEDYIEIASGLDEGDEIVYMRSQPDGADIMIGFGGGGFGMGGGPPGGGTTVTRGYGG
ncbi:MAG: efflux RND transporter periplasmic adaptor subunit [Oscillospiraceae bacterium]|jgi:HlyD family secretion protein|nr:efflux RND transporter periplasmic adaptor subunit [Oscillospiraceae bacterium]